MHSPLRLPHVVFGCVLWLSLLGPTRAESTDFRFSQTLNAEDRTAAGLPHLSSDEVAVIDALVRRDMANRLGALNGEKFAATFSLRLTAGERQTAGLAKLAPAELEKLDAFIDRHENAKLARTLLAPPSYLSRSPSRVRPDDTKKDREIHGSFSFTLGWGSGGYSEKTGSMVLNYEDPARGYSISVGYTESHIKGGSVYRDTFYDPLRDPLRNGGLLDPSLAPRP